MTDFAARREAMVDGQVRPSDVTKFPIIEGMLTIPREVFVPDAMRDIAYVGDHVELGGGRVVLDPRVLAKMLDALDIGLSDLVLDIGPALGYSSAVVAHMAEAVVALEEDPAMAEEAHTLLVGQSADNVAVIAGPLAEGAARHGPYDAILIEGGVEAVPEPILDQLKEGGRIAALFMDGPLGQVRIGVKAGGRVSWRFAFNATAPVLPGFAREREFAL
jgi:protein-L-isoaspartate(D-aspartate) O-methyltransferase